MYNLETELNLIAFDMTQIFKQVINQKGLIESGNMYNSIKWTVIKEGEAKFKFKMEAVDYFIYVDEKYGISETVYQSVEWANINKRISDAYSLWITDNLI